MNLYVLAILCIKEDEWGNISHHNLITFYWVICFLHSRWKLRSDRLCGFHCKQNCCGCVNCTCSFFHSNVQLNPAALLPCQEENLRLLNVNHFNKLYSIRNAAHFSYLFVSVEIVCENQVQSRCHFCRRLTFLPYKFYTGTPTIYKECNYEETVSGYLIIIV